MNNKISVGLMLLISIVLIYFYISYTKKEIYTENFYQKKEDQRDTYGKPLSDYDEKNYAYISVITSGELQIFYDKSSQISMYEVDSKGTFVGKTSSTNKIHHFKSEFNVSDYDRLMFYQKSSGENYWAGHIYLNGKFYPSNSANFRIVALEVKNNGNRSTNSKIMGKNNTQLMPSYKRIGCYKDGGSRRLPTRIYNSDDSGGSNQYTITRCAEMSRRAGFRYFGNQYFGECWAGNDGDRAKSYGTRDDDYYCSQASYVRPNWICGRRWTDNNTALRDCNDIPGKKTNFQVHHDGGGTDEQKDARACELCKNWSSCKGWKRRRQEDKIYLMDCYVGTASDEGSRSGERGKYGTPDRFSKAGQSWTNDIHDNQLSATTRYYGGTGYGSPWPGTRTFTRADGKGVGRLTSGSYALQPDIGGPYVNGRSYGNHIKNRWAQYEFKIEYTPLQEFCPDPKYTEFNPNGCSDPTTKQRCIDSTNDGYSALTKACENVFKDEIYTDNDWDNMNFFSTVTSLYEAIVNLRTNLSKQKEKECTGLNKEMVGDDIKSLVAPGNWGEQTDLERDLAACSLCTAVSECEFWVRDRNSNRVWLKKNFTGYEESTNRRGRLRATDFTSAVDVYELIEDIKPHFLLIADVACRMVSNADTNDFNRTESTTEYLEQCKTQIENSLKYSENSWQGSDLFVELVNKAMISSSDKYFSKGANPNSLLKSNLEKMLYEFLSLARMIIVKSEALFSNCKCSEGTAKCAPC